MLTFSLFFLSFFLHCERRLKRWLVDRENVSAGMCWYFIYFLKVEKQFIRDQMIRAKAIGWNESAPRKKEEKRRLKRENAHFLLSVCVRAFRIYGWRSSTNVCLVIEAGHNNIPYNLEEPCELTSGPVPPENLKSLGFFICLFIYLINSKMKLECLLEAI